MTTKSDPTAEYADKPALLKPIDLGSEQYRIYTYKDGAKFRINAPVSLYLLDGGSSHRVVDRDGVTHRPARGWVGISWKAKDGLHPFDF